MGVTWAKTGMLANSEIVRTVAGCIEKYGLKVVADPVMAAEAGGTLLEEEAAAVLRDELLPRCLVTTPNIREAEALSGIPVKNWKDGKKAAKRIAELGVRNVIITGGHLDASDLVYEAENDRFTTIPGRFVKGGTHGSGCTYSAALVAYLARGLRMAEAARCAKRFVEDAISGSSHVGSGKSPVDPLASLRTSAHRYHAIKEIMNASDLLLSEKSFRKLIPEVGTNIAMAVPGAETVSDVAGITGRIVRAGDRASMAGYVDFGASSHVARIVLAAMQQDIRFRAAMNIRYCREILTVCSQMGLGISSFDREDEPEETNTMDWGVSHAIERYGRVPEIIYDEGGVGKEPMIRILGRDATAVASVALEIAGRLKF
jgi:hydroxymethylpyrimidine/phosphomethylpyrimidine kinase